MQQAAVLLVDDDADSSEILGELLQGQGLAVHTAADGAQALKIYAKVRPKLVISDQKLPDISGSDLLLRLREKFGAAVGPALFLTGLKSSVKAQSGDLVLEKPVDFDTLLSTVEKLLAR